MTVERYSDGTSFEQRASYARAVRSGGWIAVSATAATGTDGTALDPGDSYAQARDSIRRAVSAAEALGAGIGDVVRTRLYLAPDCNWEDVVRAHGEAFRGAEPANTTVIVAGFIPRGVLVEVELDAFVAEPVAAD